MIVYEITCLSDRRRYIGSTIQHPEARWRAHCSEAKNLRRIEPLKVAIRQHGPDGFRMREVACARSPVDLAAVERRMIQQERTGFPEGLNGDLQSIDFGTDAWQKRRLLRALAARKGGATALAAFAIVRGLTADQVRFWLLIGRPPKSVDDLISGGRGAGAINPSGAADAH